MVDLSGEWVKLEDWDLVLSIHDLVLREFGNKSLQYTDTVGAPEAREELRRVLSRHGFYKHEVIFTTSLSDSIRFVAAAFLDGGDCIYPEDPTQREVLKYANCGRPKAVYIQPIWRNPDGYIYDIVELDKMAAKAPVVIYDLTYSLMTEGVQPRGRVTIAVGSLHPYFPGLHLGFVAVPNELFDLFVNLIESTYLHSPTYVQYVMYVAFKNRAVEKAMVEFRRREKLAREYIEGVTTPFFIWFKTREKSKFIKHGAQIGSVFSWRGGYREFIRLGLVSASEGELAEFFSKVFTKEFQSGGDSGEF
ncbi:MAG: aminotransferase [Pyrobaculum sp.]